MESGLVQSLAFDECAGGIGHGTALRHELVLDIVRSSEPLNRIWSKHGFQGKGDARIDFGRLQRMCGATVWNSSRTGVLPIEFPTKEIWERSVAFQTENTIDTMEQGAEEFASDGITPPRGRAAR
jgi:hypothetical protein